MKNIPIRQINKNQKEPDFSGSFKIRDLGGLLDGKNMVQELHRHDYFFILALKKGSGHHEIDFTRYKISDNSVFFMRPGQVHQLTLKAGSKGYLLQFKADFYFSNDNVFRQQLRKVSNKILCQPDAKHFKKLFSILTHIFHEHTNKQEGYQDVVKSYLHIFFTEFVRNRKNNQNNSKIVGTYLQERMEEFLVLLESNISKQKQASQYAGMMNLSSYQLNAITKSCMGKTCSELINECIILESKKYLLATSNQVNQIADLLGYDDVSYFIRFFKKHTGYSPEVFRNNLR